MKIFVFLFITFMFSENAMAHSVRIFAYFDNNKVHTESYFNDGKAVKNAEVKVHDSTENTLLLTGVTDSKGEFSFNAPETHSLKIIVRASMGHQAEIRLEKRKDRKIKDTTDKDKDQPLELSQSDKRISLTQEQLEKIIDEKLDEKLSPVYEILRQVEHNSVQPSLTEIFGGIGYILGLFGIASYFISKKNKQG
jgi:nickel transport protein